jgi:prepilin-type N-terminal cleavage/methylation domain-containing protein
MKRKAFTLVELLVVISIIGCIATIIAGVVFAPPFSPSSNEMNRNLPPPITERRGEAIPITLHGHKYTVIYNGPDDVKIFPQKELEDEKLSPPNRKSDQKSLP